jgi:Bacteriophage HK97-gp10, putative tail-component
MARMNKYQRQAAADYRAGAISGTSGMAEIEGLRDLQKSLRKLSKESRDEMKETHRKAGEIVVKAATPFTPVDSGALSASLKSAPTQRQGRVRLGSAAVPYAGPIHFGWPARNIRPNPFIYQVLDSRRDEVLKLYERRIDEIITKYELD